MPLAVAQFTITDMHDIYTSVTPPITPTLNQLWADTSVTPPLLRIWNGTEWVTVNDTDSIKNEITYVSSRIEQLPEEIRLEVSEKYTSKGEFEEYSTYTSTELTQVKDSFSFKFTTIEELITDLGNDTTTQFNEIIKYIRFEDGNIILGQVGNELILKIAHNRISFLQSGVEVAYMSNSKLYITDAEILSSLRIGNYAYTPRSNGNLSFTFVGK